MHSAPDSAEYLLVGRVRRAHGIRGELVVELLTDAPGAVFAPGRRLFAGTADGRLDPKGTELHVVRASPFKGGLIVHFQEIADKNAADLWRERYILAAAEDVPPPEEDEIYLHDLVGMRVLLEAGEAVGEVVAFYELPQGVVLEVQRGRGDIVLVPFTEAIVTELDEDERTIRIAPPDGLFD